MSEAKYDLSEATEKAIKAIREYKFPEKKPQKKQKKPMTKQKKQVY